MKSVEISEFVSEESELAAEWGMGPMNIWVEDGDCDCGGGRPGGGML